MSMKSLISLIRWAKLVLAVVSLQAGYAGLTIISIFALNQGMSQYTFVVYRMAIATIIISPLALIFDRNSRPRMTLPIAAKIMLLSLDPVLTQSLYYLGMKHSTATFSSAMSNILPAFAFFTAWIFRLEKVSFKSLHSLAKVLGTLTTVSGAVILTLVKGPSLSLPWAKEQHHHHPHHQSHSHSGDKDCVKGPLFIAAACLSWSLFIVLQTFTLRSYPCQLSLTALICFWGMVEAIVLALVMEWRNSAAWSIHLDVKLLTAVCGGILSGVAYYVMGIVVKEKGPVFYSAFNPLGTVMVTIMGSFVLAEQMYLGSLIGAIIIIVGLYMVLWGKTEDQPPSQSE